MKATANSMKASRRLRRELSLPEAMLWGHLRGSPGGIRFRRQYALGTYVADFYCPAAKLVIEIDGAIHGEPGRASHDANKDSWIGAQGLKVIRIVASDVLQDSEAIADALVRLCTAP